MARKTVKTPEQPMGLLILHNLLRLGHASIVPHATDLSRLVSEKTDKTLSRQRISAITNAIRVEDETLELLARAVGVKPSELLRRFD